MPWGKVEVVDQRQKFVEACIENQLTMAELCRLYGISPKNGYKWLKRYKAEGIDGLRDRSRAPHKQALQISSELIEDILEVRFRFPSWGPKKVLGFLKNEYPDTSWPSTTTISSIFDKNGLTVPRKLRKRVPARTAPLSHCLIPNDIWCADFKGWFLTRDGSKYEPFTLTDGSSRFLLRCIQLDSNNVEHVWAVLDAAFREYGLPHFFRSDNGPPFATCGAGRLSKLSINLIKAGVTPEWIDPGKPQQNGRHERMHQTLKCETANPPENNIEGQHMKSRDFVQYYNYIRPHEALGQKTPGSIYHPSPRVWNGKLQGPEYPKGMIIRKVRPSGQISLRSLASEIRIGSALVGEHVGLKEVGESTYEVYYGNILLGKIDHTKKLILPACNKRKRH